ncbi:MAG: formate dehydrogenase beta subunit, partial [Betaproteobacteria bacterium]
MEGGTVKRGRGGPGKLKGPAVDPVALAEIQALLGDAPRRRDLMVEHLHRIQDRYGYLSAAHLVALARDMRLAPTEVYEVATFYHHFDVLKDGDTPPPPVVVRVCDSLSCELAGGGELFEALRQGLGAGVRVIPAPCVGRCEQAPVAVVGRHPVAQATPAAVSSLVAAKTTECPVDPYVRYDQYRAQGGYKLAADCLSGHRDAEEIMKAMESSG